MLKMMDQDVRDRINATVDTALVRSPKCDGSWHFCISYHRMNESTLATPIRFPDRLIDKITQEKYHANHLVREI